MSHLFSPSELLNILEEEAEQMKEAKGRDGTLRTLSSSQDKAFVPLSPKEL